MSTPFFSIVIPTLNEEMYLPKLLDSLREQTFADFEVIVVDGGSQDQTQTIVKNSQLPNIKLKISRKKHVSSQRNLGASLAKADYLIFLDADVKLPPNFLNYLKKIITEKTVDFASVYVLLDSQSFFDQTLGFVSNFLMYIMSAVGKAVMTGQVMVFRKNVFAKIHGFDDSIIIAEDADISQRAAKAGFKGKYLFGLKVVVSARRFVKEGRVKVWLKYFIATFHTLFIGPVRKPLFEFKMGGGS